MDNNQKEKLESLLLGIKKFKLSMEDGVETATAIEDKFCEIKDSAQETLSVDKDSREYKLFHNWYQGDANLHWRKIPRPGSPVPKQSSKIDSLQEILEKILQSTSSKEITFSKAEGFQALIYLRKILKGANKKVVVIDAYLDDVIFDLVDGIDGGVSIYLLTHGKGNTGTLFERLYNAYVKSGGNALARINTASHDRYLIIDDEKFFHLGASLNTIGKSDFMINEIETEEEQKRKLDDFADWWKNGAII